MTAAVTAADRLGLTLFLAGAMHGLVILGVGFASEERGRQSPRALDVVLLQQETEEAPEQADYLSNLTSAGGGSSEERERPRAPVSSSEPTSKSGLAPAPLEAGAPRPTESTPQAVLTQRSAEYRTATEDAPPENREVMQRRRPEKVEYDAQVAKLAAEVDNALVEYARRPRKMFVTARTRTDVAASYMHRWVETVEAIGNTNYPPAAREQGLSGALVLVVSVRPDGSLHEVRVRASSGQPVLDEAAERIVRMAAPFEPFSEALREETDLLYITRTWEFTSGRRLETH